MGIEEAERLAWLDRLEPEADLAQLDRHWVDVDRVDAVADDVAEGGRDRRRGGLLVPGADAGQALRDPVGGRDEEVPGARAGSTTDRLEDRPLGLVLIGLSAASARTGSRAESSRTLIRLVGV